MTAAVSLTNLELFYGRKKILHNISLRVHAGEFFIIIGPNGSGKTSLLKAIAGTNSHFTGALEIMGKPLRDYQRRELSQKLAVVPQQTPGRFSI